MKGTDMQIAIPIFPRLTALDAIGPYEVLHRIPSFDVVFIGHALGEVRTENSMLGLTVDATFEDVTHPDVIVYPGGIGTRALLQDVRALDWLRTAHSTSTFTTSVCSGSLMLAAAGLLDGLTATSHYSVLSVLDSLGAISTPQRVVEHLPERIITAAGVSSCIDMALRLAALLADDTAAMAAQLMIEYDPQPPFDSGSLAKSSQAVVDRAMEYSLVRN